MTGSKKRDAAELQFHRTQKPIQRPASATTEQEEETRAIGEKTARLKALRLTKEAAEKEGAGSKITHPKTANPKR